MNHSLISSRSIIQRIISRYNITISKSEAIEWVGDGIEEIGYHAGFFNKVKKVNVINYKIDIPCDFVSLNYFIYEGKKLNYGLPKSHNYPKSVNAAEVDLVTNMIANSTIKLDLNACCEDSELEEKVYHIDILEKRASYLTDTFKYTDPSDDYYYTNSGDGYSTNAKDEVYIFYKAFPLDDENYPLIINEIKYRNAITHYLLLCYLSSGHKHPVLDYETVKLESRRLIQVAANEHFKMTVKDMEKFADNWTNMLFRISNNYNYYSNG